MSAVTGIEPAAVAGASAVAKSAAKALADDEKEIEVLRRLAEEKGALDPAARAYAKRVAVKQQLRLKPWQLPGILLGVPRQYFQNEFFDDMAERLADVPEEELVTPRTSVAGPAMLGLGFTVEEPQLKAMYLNLLAAASDKRVQASAHPSFAEVIKQLSASEAESLAAVLKSPLHLPIIEIRVKAATAEKPQAEGATTAATHVLDWRNTGEQVLMPGGAMFVDNWIRLGLVTVDYASWLIAPQAYSWVDTNPEMVSARKQFDTEEFKRVEFTKGILKPTEFGRSFERVVISSEAKALPAAKSAESAGTEDPRS